jgi:N-carbamoylputrescine amidase
MLVAVMAIGVMKQGFAQTRIVVAGAQTPNLDGRYEESKAKAEKLVIEAAEKGAKLILLPEFALIGYVFEDSIWEMAEPLEGPTVEWMRGLCRKYDVYLATCILEVKGGDFHDTLVLVGPGEGELWVNRKIEPALFEAWFFKGAGLNPSVFDTPIGRIGAAICFDTSKSHTIRHIAEGDPDIVLLTFSAPETPIVPQGMKEIIIEGNNLVAERYAQILDVPVVSVNKTGRWDTHMPGLAWPRLRSDFGARSLILDADGNVLASLEKEEAVIVAEVEIGGADPKPELIPDGRWLVPFNGLMRWFSDYTLKSGMKRYERSPERKKAVEAARQRKGPASP